MNAQYIIVGSAWLILTGCQTMGGSDAMPTVTRTGMVKDVVIREDLTPATLTANPGDEIRWINKRQGNARVVFLEPIAGMLSCQRNFEGFMGMGTQRNQYTANLSPNDSASLCFKNPSQVRYAVRADSNMPRGEDNIPGTINIGDESERTSSRNATMRDTGESAKHDTGESQNDQVSR